MRLFRETFGGTVLGEECGSWHHEGKERKGKDHFWILLFMIKQEQENHFQNKHSCFLVLGSLRRISIWAQRLFESADNVLKLSPEKVYVEPCVCFCLHVCAWICVGTIQTRPDKIPLSNLLQTLADPPTPHFSKFSFQRLMTVKIKTNDVTPNWECMIDRKKNLKKWWQMCSSAT